MSVSSVEEADIFVFCSCCFRVSRLCDGMIGDASVFAYLSNFSAVAVDWFSATAANVRYAISNATFVLDALAKLQSCAWRHVYACTCRFLSSVLFKASFDFKRMLCFLSFFCQIPPSDAMYAWNNFPCYGFLNDSAVACQTLNTGLFSAVQESSVKAVAFGHSHGDDFECQYYGGVSLYFGRHSGYGGCEFLFFAF